MNRISTRHRRGSAILVVILLLSILSLIPVATSIIQMSHQSTGQNQKIFAQADNVARAGLIDAVSWFKRQAIQPVRASSNPTAYPWDDAAFFPRESIDPTLNDTIDEDIGLVKEYSLGESTSLWARYEVLRQPSISTNPYNPRAVHDITESRVPGFTGGAGLAWSIESVGYVYRRNNAGVAFDVSPNEVVARSRASVEIRRLALNLPTNAAVIVNSRANVTVNSNGKITGNNDVGVGHYTGASGPTVSGSGAQLSGTPARVDIDGASSGSVSQQTIFGLTETELKLMADVMVSDVSGLPAEYPAMAVVFINGNATFDSTRELRGGGILYVKGTLTIAAGSNALFGGLIFATGNTVINGPALISGSVVTQGTLTLNGAGDVAQIEYDNTILNSVRQQVAQYRENKSTYYTFQWNE